MLRRVATVSAIALSLCIPAQAALAVQPIDRCVEKPHCILTTLPEAKQYQPYIPPHEGGPTSTQGTGTRYR